jgi:hypothetical protein
VYGIVAAMLSIANILQLKLHNQDSGTTSRTELIRASKGGGIIMKKSLVQSALCSQSQLIREQVLCLGTFKRHSKLL